MSTTPLDLTRAALDVSVTERSAFRSCRRRWYLETIDNLEPVIPTTALDFGTGIHHALEAHYGQTGDPVKAFQKWHKKWYGNVEEDLRGLGSIGEDALTEFWDLKALGTGMLTGYLDWAKEEDDWEVVSIEGRGAQEYFEGKRSAKLTGPYLEHRATLDQGRVVAPILRGGDVFKGAPRLSGRIDMLVERKGVGKKGLWIVDHKTTASSPSDKGLDYEDQITGYCYLVWRLTGQMPRGVIFNYLVKQLPKPVRINQATKANPLGPVSTAKDQLTTPAMYREVLRERGIMEKDGTINSETHAECYAALLERGMRPFFQRFEVQRNEHEIRSFEKHLEREYLDMRKVRKEPDRAYPNRSTWHCPNCSMGPLCLAMDDGSDVQGIIESRYQQAPDRKAER